MYKTFDMISNDFKAMFILNDLPKYLPKTLFGQGSATHARTEDMGHRAVKSSSLSSAVGVTSPSEPAVMRGVQPS
jgi:hypothetical protein